MQPRAVLVRPVLVTGALAANASLCAAAMAPGLPDEESMLCFLAVVGASLAALVAGAVLTVKLDPTDPCVVAKMLGKTPEPGSAEEQYWCGICESMVQPGSKHCWDCGRCTAHFDHHCPWLNMCIAKRNYRAFCVFIVAVLTNVTALISTAIVLLAVPANLPHEDNLTMGLLCVIIVLNLPVLAFLFCLVVFHIHLYFRGMTTYQWLKQPVAGKAEHSRQTWREAWSSASRDTSPTAKDIAGAAPVLPGVVGLPAPQRPVAAALSAAQVLCKSWTSRG